MRREYKGFYIEENEQGINGGCKRSYNIYHVVTGTLAGCDLATIKDAKEEIDSIHNNVNDYAQYAGCHPVNLTLKRGRWVYDKRTNFYGASERVAALKSKRGAK